MCYFFIHLPLYLISGFWNKCAFCSAGWRGCTYVSTTEQLGAWTDIKAIHAWGNLFYNSSRKPACASVRCSSLPAIRELKRECWLGMLINMNLCPDGFYRVYGHAKPPCLLPLPQCWGMSLLAVFTSMFTQQLCLKKRYPISTAGALGVDLATWLLLEFSHASLKMAAATQRIQGFMLFGAAWRLIVSLGDQQREEGKARNTENEDSSLGSIYD